MSTTNTALYTLSAAGVALATKDNTTQQRGVAGLGKAWRTAAVAKPNSRAVCAAAMLEQLPAEFSLEQLRAWLQANKATHLSATATAGGRIAAWLANGYIAPAAPANAKKAAEA